MDINLSEDQIERYSRQIVLKEIGGIGQKILLNSTVTLIGAGGLGSPVAYYLVAAGIGNLKIIDYDKVEVSNLHRQILHFTYDLNKDKTKSAFEKLNSLNPDCNIELINEKLVPSNVKEILRDSDFVIEGSDNLPTKFLTNDACVNLKIPFTIAGVLRWHGQVMTIDPEKKTTCYRCIFGDIPNSSSALSCSQAGVIGLIPGIVGSIQANETIKYILKIGDILTNKILYIDLLRYKFSTIDAYRYEDCIACGDNARDLIETQYYGVDEVCR